MATNKRQHFVPQCYLRRFSIDKTRKQICVYNLSKNRLVPVASVKHQCTKNYIYATSEDLSLESDLAALEGIYGRIVTQMESTLDKLEPEIIDILRMFVGLQYFRTDSSMTHLRDMYKSLMFYAYEDMGFEKPDDDLSDREWMLQSLRAFLEFKGILDDLKCCVLINNTSTQFITSDNPALLFNRFLSRFRRQQTFGVGSAGIVMTMPITPSLAVLFYDGDVYTIEKDGRFTRTLSSAREVVILNEYQFLNCSRNLYSSRIERLANLADKRSSLNTYRLDARHSVFTGIETGKTPGGTRYRSASKEERMQSESLVVGVSNMHPVPPRWPNFLRTRAKPRYFDNGSAAGPMRFHALDDRYI